MARRLLTLLSALLPALALGQPAPASAAESRHHPDVTDAHTCRQCELVPVT
ncbi:hypothetical protein ABT248_17540 [Streptomyces sp. NPDC000971]|uniref:hypothetical protein n=1 Tax=Streptomyces TaxID=1883 RepID=UPI0023AEFD0C|nr:hypothetical protein [Streptomyces sp. KA12]MDF0374606.1 hypothetical protein [Streptomyces sp. KA12]